MPNAMNARFRRLLRIILPEGSAQEPRDARPNRSTPSLSRPCEVDAGFRVERCLLSAHRFSAGSARFDGPTLLRPKQDGRAPLCPEKDVYVKNININRSRDRSERPFKNVKSEKAETRDLRKRLFSFAAHGS